MLSKTLLLVAALAGGASARVVKSSDLATYTFDMHSKNFAIEDTPAARAAFVAELARVTSTTQTPSLPGRRL